MITGLYIGNDPTDLLDLYGDENIEMNSSVTDIEDIEKNTTEFIKTFTVPASNKNNRKFKHYYNADIDNSFDARIKVEGGISLNGFGFKLGKYRLSKVSMKNNKPSSYTIQFWGNLISLKDSVGKDLLSDLDLSEFDHDYTSNNVKAGLTGSLINANIIYNLFVKKQYYYSTDPGDKTITDQLVNIAYGDGLGDNGITWSDLRPSIRIIEIIKAIEAKYGFTFSRDYFGRAEFLNLFMWLNPSASGEPGGGEQMVDFDSGDTTNFNLTTNIGTFDVSTSITYNIGYTVTVSAGFEDVEYTVKFYKNGELSTQTTVTGTQTFFIEALNISGTGEDFFTWDIYFEVSSNKKFDYEFEVSQSKFVGTFFTGSVTTFASENNIVRRFIVSDEFPKMKVIDFLKGIFKKDKLVIIPTDFDNLYVNTLVDYYAEGDLIDITRYVDNTSHDVNRGKLLNEINFTFTEPTTILNTQFEINTGKGYGDEENEIKDEDGNPLDGDKLDYKLPFEQIVYERLIDVFINEIANVQYGAIIKDDLTKANPKPHIFYSINTSLGSTQLSFIDDLGNRTLLNNSINIPSHTMTLENVNFSTVFSEEFSEWTNVKITNTLYKNYHKDFIDSLFNIKRRDYKFNAKLPFRILSKLELNDIFKIRDNYYRISNYNLNLLTAEAELNLISSFDAVIGGFSASITDIFVDYKAQIQSIYVTNLGNSTFDKVDNGFDVDWVSVSSVLNNVYFSIALNETGLTRDMFVDITNEGATKTIRVYVNQTGGNVTVDNTTITVDNNIITVDNG
jgi:hypothetical protein